MNSRHLFYLLPMAVLAACSQASENYSTHAVPCGDTASMEEATMNNDSQRKIIKTADLRCRVTDVYAATTDLERLVRNMGGQVTVSSFENNATYSRDQYYSDDTVKHVSLYTTTSHLTLRIPEQYLDTVLNELPHQYAFVDSRHLRLQDMTYNYLENKMKNEAANNLSEQALQRSKKSNEVLAVSSYDDQRASRQIDRTLNNMMIMDKVRFATLDVDLYQPDIALVQLLPDTENIFRPGLGTELWLAVKKGWQFIIAFVLLTVQLWPLVLTAVIVAILYKKKLRPALLARRNPMPKR